MSIKSAVLQNTKVGTHRLNLGTGDDATKDKSWWFVLKEPEYIK